VTEVSDFLVVSENKQKAWGQWDDSEVHDTDDSEEFYECPECGFVLFTDYDSAVRFLACEAIAPGLTVEIL
jgi:hypothetical protein